MVAQASSLRENSRFIEGTFLIGNPLEVYILLLSESARDIVFNSILYWKDKKFNLLGAVVMPDHEMTQTWMSVPPKNILI